MGWLAKRIKENGTAVSDHFARSDASFDLTPAGCTLIHSLEPLISSHVRGRALDAGAGRLTYHSRLSRSASSVVSLDRYRVRGDLSIISDLSCLPFADSSFDSVFCSQVLEHVPEPSRVLAEFSRILQPGGKLVLSVPHLAYLHNEPHDYFRYTEFGLRHLLAETGFEVVEMRWTGGVLSFLGHMPSTLAINLAWGVPLLFPVVFNLNRLWSRALAWLERGDKTPRRFALNIALAAVKGGITGI